MIGCRTRQRYLRHDPASEDDGVKITDAHIRGFGVWNDMTVRGLSPEVTLFYGPNEAGKTTLMQFSRAVLYGFSDERRRLYFPPVFGGTPGGVLRVQNHSGEFSIERSLEDDDQATFSEPASSTGRASQAATGRVVGRSRKRQPTRPAPVERVVVGDRRVDLQ